MPDIEVVLTSFLCRPARHGYYVVLHAPIGAQHDNLAVCVRPLLCPSQSRIFKQPTRHSLFRRLLAGKPRPFCIWRHNSHCTLCTKPSNDDMRRRPPCRIRIHCICSLRHADVFFYIMAALRIHCVRQVARPPEVFRHRSRTWVAVESAPAERPVVLFVSLSLANLHWPH